MQQSCRYTYGRYKKRGVVPASAKISNITPLSISCSLICTSRWFHSMQNSGELVKFTLPRISISGIPYIRINLPLTNYHGVRRVRARASLALILGSEFEIYNFKGVPSSLWALQLNCSILYIYHIFTCPILFKDLMYPSVPIEECYPQVTASISVKLDVLAPSQVHSIRQDWLYSCY